MQSISNTSTLFFGDWSSADVFVEEIDSTREINSALEAKSKQSWNTMFIEATQTNRKLWNSDVYRFESVGSDEGNLHLSFSTIPFSIRLGMNAHTNEIRKLGITYAPQGIFTSCFVRTTDNIYVFIEKSQHYFTRKKLSFVGGIVSRSEQILASGQDLFGEVEKEIREEIGVSIGGTHYIRLKAGYLTENLNACFLFEALIPFTFSEVLKSFSEHHDKEAENIIGFPKDILGSQSALFEPKDAMKFKMLELI